MPIQIPFGVADYFWGEAFARQQLLNDLLETFRRWGYGDVIPPMFEYAETLSVQASEALQAEMYRFLDRDGRTLALRPEFTTQVARLVGVRLHDWPMPQRFCYGGSCFRYVDPQAGRQREFWQAGLELIGASSPVGDAEVLALTAEALRVAGLEQFRIVLGQTSFFAGLLAELSLSEEQERALRWAIERKSEPALAAFLREAPLATGQRQAVEALPQLAGADVDAVIRHAERHARNHVMHSALADLRAIAQAVDAYGELDVLVLDLTEIRNLGYYTGISFEALVPEVGAPVGSGGRYDGLVGQFGPAQPAVGVALGVDRLLLARQRQTGADSGMAHPQPPDAVARVHGSAAALEAVRRLRAEGQRIQVELEDRSLEQVFAYAARVGVETVLDWEGEGFRVYRREGKKFATDLRARKHP